MSGALLVRALAEPATVPSLDDAGWTALLTAARAEQLLASLGHRVAGLAVPDRAAAILADARASAEVQRTHALWEAEMARRALAPLGLPVVLLKGTAFVAAGLAAGVGRSIGDLDILVPKAALPRVERALLAAGWEWAKPDAYDDAYYRRWMHELPPLIHRTRDRMIDVHHTILPPTARPMPDPEALIAAAVPLGNGLSVLSPADRIVHAAAHLLADGDLAGGLRNLWDIDRLLREDRPADLARRAALHGLTAAVARALRLAARLYGTPMLEREAAFPPRTTSFPFVSSPATARGAGAADKLPRGAEVETRRPVPPLDCARNERSGSVRHHEDDREAPLARSRSEEEDAAPTGSARTGRGRVSDRLFVRRLLARDDWGRASRPVTRFVFYIRSHVLRMPPHMLARHLAVKWWKARRSG